MRDPDEAGPDACPFCSAPGQGDVGFCRGCGAMLDHFSPPDAVRRFSLRLERTRGFWILGWGLLISWPMGFAILRFYTPRVTLEQWEMISLGLMFLPLFWLMQLWIWRVRKRCGAACPACGVAIMLLDAAKHSLGPRTGLAFCHQCGTRIAAGDGACSAIAKTWSGEEEDTCPICGIEVGAQDRYCCVCGACVSRAFFSAEQAWRLAMAFAHKPYKPDAKGCCSLGCASPILVLVPFSCLANVIVSPHRQQVFYKMSLTTSLGFISLACGGLILWVLAFKKWYNGKELPPIVCSGCGRNVATISKSSAFSHYCPSCGVCVRDNTDECDNAEQKESQITTEAEKVDDDQQTSG